MAIVVSYQDWLEKPISEQQKKSLDKYFVVTSDEGLVQKKEGYENNVMYEVIYYMQVNESKEDVLLHYKNVRTVAIRTRSKQRFYVIEDEEEYMNGVLTFRAKYVRDAAGRRIYSSPLSLSGVRDVFETVKFFYGPDGNLYYTFWYGEGGLISSMESLNPIHRELINDFVQDFAPNELDTLVGLNWNQMLYYHSVDPIVPSN